MAGLKNTRVLGVWREAWGRFSRTPGRGRKAARTAGLAFTALLSAYLLIKLTRVGWGRVGSSIPRTPWFYLAVAAKYLTLPVFQAFVFQWVWKKPFRELLPVSLNKRVLDKNVLDMSGDVYLYKWARTHVSSPPKEIILVLKDNLLVSSAASVFVALVFFAALLAFGPASLPEKWLAAQWRFAPLAAAVATGVAALGYRFRRTVFFLGKRTLGAVFLLHLARTALVQVFQVVEWAVVLPDIALDRWLVLLAVNMIISYVPFLPSRNLIFFGAGLEMAGHLAIPMEGMAGIFLAANVTGQALSLLTFLWASVNIGRAKNREEAAAEAQVRESAASEGLS